ncbi:MAG: XrtA system polysaccharide deacetylase [Gammaproteobacteria bacterium]|nr:XrtA system polysaccharide deacetylase [Gammaproteobacteria bacterium]
MNRANDITNALTVDVEDYFQVSAFERVISRSDWDAHACRVEQNTDRLLALFGRHRVAATFFVLGWIAERYPAMVRRILEQGHEVASHGYDHTRATTQTRTAFKEDVDRTRRLLEDITGGTVAGFRAASFSIGRDNLWALEALKECGYHYSSSIYPVRHDLYGMPEAPLSPFRYSAEAVVEIPLSTRQLLGRNLPASGGGFFRLFPYAFSRNTIRHINRHDGRPVIFYFHPWEIDPHQPRPQGATAKTRFRHYLNLDVMESRLERLLTDFSWGRMDRVFEQDIESASVVDLAKRAA